MGLIQLLFIASTLLLWGFATKNFIWTPVLISILIAGHFFSKRKILISSKTNSRAMDITFIGIAFCALWFYFTRASSSVPIPFKMLALCPILFFPKIIFILFTHKDPQEVTTKKIKDGVGLAFSYITRQHSHAHQKLDAPSTFDYPIAYALMCLFVAMVSLPQLLAIIFAFVFLAFLTTYTAYKNAAHIQTIRSSLLFLVPSCIIALGLGAGIHYGINQLSERFSPFWNNRVGEGLISTTFATTAIGNSGALDAGNKLLYRIKWDEPKGYLRTGTYSYLSLNNGKPVWMTEPGVTNGRGSNDRLIVSNQDDVFELQTNYTQSVKQAFIATNLAKERNALATPQGSIAISGLPLDKLESNRFSALATSGSPGFVQFSLSYSPTDIFSDAPTQLDLNVPTELLGSIDRLLLEAGIDPLNPPPASQSVSMIQQFFLKNWQYTLDLQTSWGVPRTLNDFFFNDRKGHCEFFATTTALMLRRIGIPSRYETGFSVSEYNSNEQLHWVRTRDAHAWNLYWDGQNWHNTDNTVPGITQFYSSSSVNDLLEQFQYFLDTFDINSLLSQFDRRWLYVILTLLGLYLALRIARSKRVPESPLVKHSILDQKYHQLHQLIQTITEQKCPPDTAPQDFWVDPKHQLPATDQIARLAQMRYSFLYAPSTHKPSDDDQMLLLDSVIRQLQLTIKERKKNAS